MAFADPYDEWKAQGRPGGNYTSWQSQQFPAAPTAAPAAPTPAAPAPAPGGVYRPPAPTSGPAPAPTAGAAPSVADIRAQSAGQSEDFGRFSDAAIQEWNKLYDASASQAAGRPQYRSSRGAPGFFDKPTECPPGQGPSGPNETDPCTTKGYSEGGGGGAGGGGGDVGTAGAGAGGDISSLMESNLKGMLAGGTRYDPKTMQGLLAAIKQRIESSKGTQLRQAGEEAAARGMSRAGRTGTNLAAIRRGAESQFTGEYANTLRAKIDADRQDKVDALDRSQRYLDSMRDELYRRDMSAIQRQQFKANLDLAYANIANQRQTLSSQQQYGREMLGAQYGYQATFGGL